MAGARVDHRPGLVLHVLDLNGALSDLGTRVGSDRSGHIGVFHWIRERRQTAKRRPNQPHGLGAAAARSPSPRLGRHLRFDPETGRRLKRTGVANRGLVVGPGLPGMPLISGLVGPWWVLGVFNHTPEPP
jgi:hypothetical protein